MNSSKWVAIAVVLVIIVAIIGLALKSRYGSVLNPAADQDVKNTATDVASKAADAVDQTASGAADVMEKVKDLTLSSWRATLSEQNGSKELGAVGLSEANGETTVTIALSGEPDGAVQPAHIHLGSCPNPGAVKYPLANVVNGKSETVLPVTIAQLKGMMPLAVNVHKSAGEISVYVACGDLK